MFKEKNIPKLIFLFPLVIIIITSFIITFLLIREDYQKLNNDINNIRKTHIENEKIFLKTKIDEILRFIEYAPKNSDPIKLQNSVIKLVQHAISKKKGYIYIIDDKGTIIFHPNLDTGVDSSSIVDANGLYIAKALINTAKKNPKGGYVSYLWYKIGDKKQEKKTAFVYYIKNWNWIISTGSYMDEVEKEISKKVLVEEEIIEEKIEKTITTAAIIILSVLIFSYSFSVFLNKIFIDYRRTVQNKRKELNRLNSNLEKIANEEKIKRTIKEKELKSVFTDRVTGLPNRLKLSKDLRGYEKTKLMLLNINRFTDINNFYSHVIADKLLKEIANFLVNLFKDNKNISIYKLPIDEYAILLNSNKMSSFEFIEICKTVIANIEYNPFIINDNEIIVSITGGISIDQKDSFINADTALKIAKNKNKDYIIFNEDDNIEINYQNNIKMTKILKDAIAEDRIVVFKQPIVCNKNKPSDTIKKYECLIRIKEKDGSFISPYLFLDIAKKIKLYPKLTRAVIQKSFEYFKDQNCDFSINLTLDDILNDTTVRFIKYKLDTSNIAHHVIFEIVETEGIDNFEEVSLFIKSMKEYGCRIAIDDFGTGYSNFNYLMKLNVDFIKIDGSFIKNIDTDIPSQVLTELIVLFAKKQNIKTIAEFVHSPDILGKVKSLDIDFSQGYFLGEPQECI